jgi:septal ring-binding cell division protein DamX
MDLPPNDFAVQLKADRTLSGIQTFAREVSLDSPLVLKTIPSKSPLYILVLETFNDIQLASDAKNQWISQFDNGIEPWIRTVGSIQKTLHPIGPLD